MLVLVATSTPGPAVLFIITNATLYGWKKAIFAALGNIAGLLCLGILAITGLGTMVQASVEVFHLIRYAGAAYLIYLGLKLVLDKPARQTHLAQPISPASIPSGKLFAHAFGVAVSNPKAIVFLTALFPQFIDVSRPLPLQFAALISVLMLFSFSFLMGYALVAHQAKAWLNQPGRIRIFNRTSGSIFIGFGLLLATAKD